jgi:hypothetical protein
MMQLQTTRASSFIVSVKGDHFHLQDPCQAPNSGWYCHNTSRASLTYQIVPSLCESKILSVVGPCQASLSDITVFRCPNRVFDLIPNCKLLIGDKGYQGSPDKISIPNPNDSTEVADFKK